MEENVKKDSNTTMMALAALMFFSPFMHYLLNKWSLTISDQEKGFIRGYVKLWYINRVFLAITIASGIGNYFVTSTFLRVLYAICIGIVLILLIVWSLCVLSDVSLNITKDFSLTFYEVWDKKSLLLKFLPLYNVYARYKLHSFGTPNRWLKESLLWRTFFILLALGGHPLILSVIVALRLLRITTLMAGIDVLHVQAKSDISNLFFKNPEEIRWYFTGTIIYLGKTIGKIFHVPATPVIIQNCIQSEKDAYSRLYNVKNNREIWLEYLIGWGLLFLYWYLVRPDLTQWNYYLPLIVIIWRYLIMLIVRWYLPSLPLAREIRIIISTPFRFLVHKRADVQA
jgi:hypothetical protein